MKEIGSVAEFQETIRGDVVVDFHASWCGPCQTMGEMLARFDGVVGVDIDELPELAEEYEVMSIPCLVKFRGGKEVERKVGLIPERKLRKFMGRDEKDAEDAEDGDVIDEE